METKEQCKTCEIINADCNACKSFLETREQKIERLKKEIRNIKENIKDLNKELMLHRILKKEKIQQLKELKNKGE